VFATKGGATATTLSDWVANVADEFVSCLTNVDGFTTSLGETLKSQISASIEEESEWIYWDL
jgi:hypothetical protein